MLRKTVRGVQHVALLLARIVVGVVLVARGWHRWMDAGIDAQAAVLAAEDLPAPDLLAWAVTIFELAGGVLLIFGLATPIVGLGMVVLQIGVALLRHPDALLAHEGGMEYPLVQAAVGLVFLAFGSGKLGADALFFPAKPAAEPAAQERPAPPPPREQTLYSQETHS